MERLDYSKPKQKKTLRDIYPGLPDFILDRYENKVVKNNTIKELKENQKKALEEIESKN